MTYVNLFLDLNQFTRLPTFSIHQFGKFPQLRPVAARGLPKRLQSKGVDKPLADQFVLQAGENRGTDAFQFEATNGTFRDSNGETIDRNGINAIGSSGFGKKALASGSTLARHAVLRSLLRTISEAKRGTDGRPDGILDAIRKFADQHQTAADKLFYSRGQSSATGLTADQFTAELAKAFGAKVAERLQVNFRTRPQRNKKFSATSCAD